eukprot:TRINITY_DN17245_c0_g1_i1.p1 TRINITY_DN17245_c0_g1~~TRINITY_DN17245_c0_g1_i1.p1  ORF type:complete len:478 (+),score=124.85 TRINITY_DN17245_c0_g1_i1:62-1495(+)
MAFDADRALADAFTDEEAPVPSADDADGIMAIIDEEEGARILVTDAEEAAWQKAPWHRLADGVRVAASQRAEKVRLDDLKQWYGQEVWGRRRRLSRIRPLPLVVSERIRTAAAALADWPGLRQRPRVLSTADIAGVGPLLIQRLWWAKAGDVADELAANLSIPLGVGRLEVIADAAQSLRALYPAIHQQRWESGLGALCQVVWAAEPATLDGLLAHPDGAPDDKVWHSRKCPPNPCVRDVVAAAVRQCWHPPLQLGHAASLDAAVELQRWVKTLCTMAAVNPDPDPSGLPRSFLDEVLVNCVASDGRLRLVAACAEWRDGLSPALVHTAERFGVAGKSLSGGSDSDADGVNAVHCAAVTGGAEQLAAALLLGADMNARTTVGASPAHYAASQGRDGALAMLLGAGAALDAEDDEGRTPLQWAAAGGHLRTVQLLRDCDSAKRGDETRMIHDSRQRGEYILAGDLAGVSTQPRFGCCR